MKTHTVKELAYLLDDYDIGVTFTEDGSAWVSPEMFDTNQELVNKYGERTIKWISFDGSEDEIYQAIELEGDRV